jgi:uncharacterized protein
LSAKELREVVVGFGHENIQAIHHSTLMFTKEGQLSKTGDCIIAIAADKAASDLSQTFKDRLRAANAKLTIVIEADGLAERISASGSPKLILTHTTDTVIRKSDFISDRTLAIHADKSSNDLSRQFVDKLKNPKQKITITLIISS